MGYLPFRPSNFFSLLVLGNFSITVGNTLLHTLGNYPVQMRKKNAALLLNYVSCDEHRTDLEKTADNADAAFARLSAVLMA